MTRAWKKIQRDPRVAISIETRTIGICVVAVGIEKRDWRIALA